MSSTREIWELLGHLALWFSTLPPHMNHMKSFQKYQCLGPIPRDSDLLDNKMGCLPAHSVILICSWTWESLIPAISVGLWGNWGSQYWSSLSEGLFKPSLPWMLLHKAQDLDLTLVRVSPGTWPTEALSLEGNNPRTQREGSALSCQVKSRLLSNQTFLSSTMLYGDALHVTVPGDGSEDTQEFEESAEGALCVSMWALSPLSALPSGMVHSRPRFWCLSGFGTESQGLFFCLVGTKSLF